MAHENESLRGKTIVIGVTGGIAAYKAPDIVRRLKKLGAEVFVIMTANATQFVTKLTFESVSGNPVVTDMFESPAKWEIEHIALAKRADLFLIAPATANILAKMACGLADDMLSTTVLATRAPVLCAPAMNTGMYVNAATQHNLSVLKGRGVHFVGPEDGLLAEGGSGIGRMSEPSDVVNAACALFLPVQDLAGVRVLVTAGPTREAVDPVRFITNRSSGKMGYALAEAAKKRGAEVTLITGPVALEKPTGMTVVGIETAADLLSAMLTHAGEADIILQAAAPADFSPQTQAEQKIKKQGDAPLTLTLVQTVDVAKTIGEKKRPGQVLVVFAAETGAHEDHAREKLLKKNADLVVLNDVTKPGAGFDVDTNIVTLITREEIKALPLLTKAQAAEEILNAALRFYSQP